MTVWFDMDGTISDLYGVENWLEKLQSSNPEPYAFASVMVNMSLLARYLNKIQKNGYSIGIISWLSKNSTDEYDELVTEAKLAWLKIHLKSVTWDEVHIVKYGTPKWHFMTDENDILFDDEQKNRDEWGSNSYSPETIIEILKQLARKDDEEE